MIAENLLNQLNTNKNRWVQVGLDERIHLLDQMITYVHDAANDWVTVCLAQKAIQPNNPMAIEEWLGGPVNVLRLLRSLRSSLIEYKNTKKISFANNPMFLSDGRIVVQVFPKSRADRILFKDISGDIWFKKDQTISDIYLNQFKYYKDKEKISNGEIALVLSSGNMSGLSFGDVIHKLFVENKVVIFKPSELLDGLLPIYKNVFRDLIREGYLQIITGDSGIGAELCKNQLVSIIHITGSHKTYQKILANISNGKTLKKNELKKSITAELGNITPIIVVPGTWNQKEVSYQAENIVSMMVMNAGFNCLTPRILITHANWTQRNSLLDEIRILFSKVPLRKAYYPGAKIAYDKFCNNYSAAEHFGKSKVADELPWVLASGLSSENDELCFREELFCNCYAEVQIEAESIAEYLEKAVIFCNEKLWGTLAVTLIADPVTSSHSAPKRAIEKAITNLKYGRIDVNVGGGIGRYLANFPVGAYPCDILTEVQSGIGFMGNALFVENVEKIVIKGPFYLKKKPLNFITLKNTNNIAIKLIDYEAKPSFFNFCRLVMAAFLNS
jgi:hypothetical protein